MPQVGCLKTMLKAGGVHKDTKLVIISSCSSERSGDAFVEAGVPHVVAVRNKQSVSGEYCFCCVVVTVVLVVLREGLQFDRAVTVDRSPSKRVHRALFSAKRGGLHTECKKACGKSGERSIEGSALSCPRALTKRPKNTSFPAFVVISAMGGHCPPTPAPLQPSILPQALSLSLSPSLSVPLGSCVLPRMCSSSVSTPADTDYLLLACSIPLFLMIRSSCPAVLGPLLQRTDKAQRKVHGDGGLRIRPRER